MRHKKRNRILNRSKGERESLLRHLSRALILKGRIETTVPKAKEACRMTERLIQFGLRGDLTSYRRATQILGDAETTSFLFKEIAPLFKSRTGGYTRILRSRTRPGDGAELATLELVEQRVIPEKKKEKPQPKKEKPKAVSTSAEGEKKTPPPSKGKDEERTKRGGFFASLRKFIKPKDRSS